MKPSVALASWRLRPPRRPSRIFPRASWRTCWNVLQLIDVREEWEWQIARLPGARLIPLGRVDDELATIDRSKDIVLYCKSGVRSLHAAEDPAAAEFTKLANLSGGITRWNHDVDPTVLRY